MKNFIQDDTSNDTPTQLSTLQAQIKEIEWHIHPLFSINPHDIHTFYHTPINNIIENRAEYPPFTKAQEKQENL